MKKVIKFLLIVVIACIALVGVVEVGLRLLAPVEPEIPTSLIFNNKIPGFKEKVKFDVGTDLLRRHGWAEGDKPAGEVRVVCVGGPSTASVFQNVEETWWGQLKQKLEQANPGTKYAFGALGVQSKGIRFGAKWAQTYLEELQPDVVIIQYGIEDVLMHPESYEYDSSGMDGITVKRTRSGLKKVLMDYSQIARRISRGRQESRRKLNQKQIGQPNYYAIGFNSRRRDYQELDLVFSVPRGDGHDPLAEYLEGLKTLVSVSREAGAKVMIVGEPSLCGEFIDRLSRSVMMMPVVVNDSEKPVRKPEPGWVEKELYRYYAHGKEYAEEARVPFVNLQGAVQQDTTYFFNEAILTDAGAAKVAELLFPEVQKLIGRQQSL